MITIEPNMDEGLGVRVVSVERILIPTMANSINANLIRDILSETGVNEFSTESRRTTRGPNVPF